MKLSHSRAGVTITELLVGVVISSIAASVALNFSLFFYQSQLEVIAKLQTEENLIRASYVLQRLISTASDLDIKSGAAVDPIGNGNTRGQIRSDFNGTSFASSGGQGAETVIAAFRRDNSSLNPIAAPIPITSFTPVLISYIAPKTDKSGVIFVNPNQRVLGVLSSSYDYVFFDKITEFGLTEFVTAGPSAVPISLKVHITMRHFFKNDVNLWFFCPDTNAGDRALCNMTQSPFKDLTRDVRITILNQVTNTNDATLRAAGIWERTLGNIYVFPVGINR